MEWLNKKLKAMDRKWVWTPREVKFARVAALASKPTGYCKSSGVLIREIGRAHV